MLKIHRNAPSAMASFNRLLTAARASHFGKTGFPSILASRGFCHRATFATSLHASPISAARLVETASRAYATTTTKRKTTAKKTATPKKPAAKKKTATKKKTAAKKKTATKKAKKPKKKVVKKAKKTPAKVSKPKVITLPSPRPVSGYVLFIRDVMSGNTIPMTEASAQWKAISDPEKETWNSRAQAESINRKRQFDQALAKLSPSQIREENQKRRILARKYSKTTAAAKKKLIKDPKAPKRPRTAYLRYAIEHYTRGTPILESAKQSSAAWKSLGSAEKRSYQQAYQAEKAEYEKAMAAYMSS